MALSSKEKAALIQEMSPVVRALKRHLADRLVALVLYGSRARREARKDSDWDLLVIAKGLPPRILQRNRFLHSLLPQEWRFRVSILAKTPEEFERLLPPLYLDIALDGIILYDLQDYMRDKLAFIRKKIQDKGLQRKRKGANWLWVWKIPPHGAWELEWTS